MVTDDQLISDLSLNRHPEGGWFRRTYESAQSLELERGERACASSILYFLKANEISCLHQLQSDEIWYFHSGSPLKIHQFASGHYSQVLLGTDFVRQNQVQHIIDAGTVFGAECMGEERGTLISCMVSPGYDEADFNWARTEELLGSYPEQREIIEKLSPKLLG